MRLSDPMIENCVTMLGWSPSGHVIARMLEGVTLPGEYALVAERCAAYWRRFKQPPGVHLVDQFTDIFAKKGDPRAPGIRFILNAMLQIKDGINEQFVLSRMSAFVRINAMRAATVELVQVLARDDDETTLTEAEGMVGNLLRARQVEFEPGLKLGDVETFVDWLHTERGIPLGIEPLDRIGVTPQRGTLFCMIGVTGQGKTWWEVHCGVQALRQRQRVVHISLEIAAPAVLGRYYQCLFGASEHQVKHAITELQQDRGHVTGMTTTLSDPEFAFRNEAGVNVDLTHELSSRLRTMGRSADNLRIRAWPPRVVSVDAIEAYLDTLADAEHYEPDLILVDYPQLMKLNPTNYRLELGQTVEHLRRLGIERNAAVVIVHQASRAGAKSKSVGMTHVAEDWSVVQTADFVLSYSATLSEQRLRLARLHIDKARVPGAVGKTMILSQNYDIGQYALSAVLMPDNYMDYLEKQVLPQDAEPEDTESESEPVGLFR